MTDEIADAALDQWLRAADPLGPASLPSAADTEAALRRLLAAGPDGARERAASRMTGRRSRPRLVAGATASAAAVATTLVLLLSATASAPAFAVTRNPNGTVTVQLIKLSGLVGANRELATMGIRAKIVTAESAMADARYVAALHPCQGRPAGTVRTVTFDPGGIPRSQLLFLAADPTGQFRYYSTGPTTADALALDRARSLVERTRAIALSAPSNVNTGARKTTEAVAGTPTQTIARNPADGHALRVYCAGAFARPAGGNRGNRATAGSG